MVSMRMIESRKQLAALATAANHSPSSAAMAAASYACVMEQQSAVEDSRGVDVSQIRRQLRMTVPERVQSMVEAANTMLAIQEHAQASLRRAR